MFGVLMALDFAAKGAMSIGKGIKSLWDKYKGNEPPATEIEQLRSEVRNLQQEMRNNQQELLDRLDPGRQARVADPDEFSVAESDVEASLVDNRRVARQELIEDGLKGQAGQVERLAEYEVGPQLEQVADNIRAGNQAIQQAQDPAALDSALDKASENLAANLDDIEHMVASIRTQLTSEAGAELQTAQDDVSQLHEDEQSVADQQGDAEGSEGGDDDLPIGEDV
jgi:gas vesicle protein